MRRQKFVGQWVKDWNAHDVDAVVSPFADDVFTSPIAARLPAATM